MVRAAAAASVIKSHDLGGVRGAGVRAAHVPQTWPLCVGVLGRATFFESRVAE